MEKKKVIDRILIVTIILVSILGITYKVFADGPIPTQGTPQHAVPWYENAGWTDGIIQYLGGDSKSSTDKADSGTLHFGLGGNGSGVSSSGGGGTQGGGGSWNGSIAGFDKSVSSPSSSYSPGSKGEIWFDDVCDNIDVLCTQQGVGITGKNKYIEDDKAVMPYWETRVEEYEDPRFRCYAEEDALDAMKLITEADKKESEYQEYYRTSSKYSGTDRTCTPSEAFVLSEAKNVSGSGERTPLQDAWWAVTGTGSGGNALSEGAFAFQNYVYGSQGGTPTTYSDENGTFTGFPIKFEPQFANTEPNYSVSFDEINQQYIIGPLRIDYYQCEPFAFMKNIDIYADNSDTPLDKNEYYIALDSGNNNLNKIEDGVFPANGEDFYIILNYNENFRKITNIKADFQYMNGGGRYTYYTGTYTKVCIQGHIYGQFDYPLFMDIVFFRAWLQLQINSNRVISLNYGGGAAQNTWGKSILQIQRMLIANPASMATAFETRKCPSQLMGYFTLLDGGYLTFAESFYDGVVKPMATTPEDERKEGTEALYAGYEQLYNSGRPTDRTHSVPDPLIFDVWKDLEYINMGDETAQAQSISGGAARWWEYKTIEWEDIIPLGAAGAIKISKEIDGEAKDGDVFEFTVKVDGYEEEKLQITYKNGGDNTVESRMYTWENGAAPRYEVTEATKNGYRLDNITNRVGNLQDGQSVQVAVKNNAELKNSTLQIYKEIKKTNLDTNQYSLVDKIYKFRVTISGDCEVTYGGQTYSVTEESPKTFDLDIRSFAEGAADAEKDSKSAKMEVKWYQEAPRYEVEEIPNEQNNAPIVGSNLVKITPTSGELKNNEVVKVEAQNEIAEQKAKIQVVKTLEGYENYSDAELEKFVFRFKVNVYRDAACTNKLKTLSGAEYNEQIVEAKLSRTDDGKWQWTGTTPDEYIWAYGNYPYFKVEEIGICPHDGENCKDANCVYIKNINFNVEKTRGANSGKSSIIEIGEKYIIGQLNEGAATEGVFDCNVVNSTEATKGVINVNKTVEGNVQDPAIKDALRRKDFSFTIKLKGTFTYNGNLYRDKVIQLTTNANKCNELNSIDEYNDKDFVVINLNGANEKTWTSDEITWYGEAPYYIVEEHTAGLSVTDGNGNTREVNVSGVPQAGLLNEGTIESGKYNVTVKAKNSIDENAGYIKIIKKLENSERCSEDYIKQVRFKFDVKVFKTDGTSIDEKTVVLGTEAFPAKLNEKDGTWYWEWESPRYSWDAGANALKYSVEEKNEFPVGISFVKVEGENGETIEQNKITGTIQDSGEKTNENPEAKITTDAIFTNKVEARSGKLQIRKQLVKSGLDITKFKFKVTLNGKFYYGNPSNEANLKQGTYEINVDGLNNNGEWMSSDIYWFGSAPTYVVEELKSEEAKLVTMQNAVGTLKESSTPETVTAVFINEGKEVGGHLKVTKSIVGEGIAIDEKFTFRVTINAGGKSTTQYISINANETWTSDYISWNEGDQIPTYEVEEIELPDGSEFVEMKGQNPSGRIDRGSFSKDRDVSVVAINRLQQRSGEFKVTKKVVFNKLIDTATAQEFTMDIKIAGTFNIDGRQVNNDSYTITVKLKADETYTSPRITWYGDNAPIITVTERVKEGWDRPSYSNNGDTAVTMLQNQTIEVVVTNRINVEMDLTMDLGGKVWEDEAQDPEGKNTADSVPNGMIDSSEKGLDGVEVYVYRVVTQNGKEIDRKIAVSHKDVYDAGMQNPVITSGGGNWKVTGLSVTGFTNAEKAQGYAIDRGYRVKYDVEFVYDGQTYEPTKALSYKEGNGYKEGSVQNYVDESPSNRVSKYGNSSLALDYDREQVNDRIREIYGKTPIDGAGNTISTVNGSEGARDVRYKAVVPSSETTRVESKLQTTNESGIADDLYKTKARTSVTGLQFPVDNAYKLEYTNTTYTLNGVTQNYKAIYGHCLHINLGLVKREDIDLEASKDLYSAKVVVDGKELNYKFNRLSDLISKSTKGEYNRVSDYRELDAIKYELGLYKTDYYYRAEIYKGNAEIYDNVIQNYYVNTFGKIPEDSEIKVYLTYKINLYNNSSQKYKVRINSVDDYVETSLGMPINAEVREVVNGAEKTVAVQAYSTGSEKYYLHEGEARPNDTQNVEWQLVESNIKGADGSTYNKFKTKGNLNLELNSGANKYIYVTFAVQKETINNIDNSIILGNKSNIVEIANYSTYYTDGRVAGKLDKDSAPSNLNIRNYNDEKIWYEDDTSAAPVLSLNLIGEERQMNGIAWEDKADATGKGDGIRQDDEALIGGLTTELIEKIKVPSPAGTTEYDFLWPTHEKLDCLGGKTLEYLTGFDSTTETSRIIEKEIIDGEEKVVTEVGQYKFKGIPTGEYVVRFLYGNDKTELEDTKDITTRPAEALKADGTKYAAGDEILTANYDGDIEGFTESIYNGQDYKSTIYQAGLQSITSEGYLNNANHDLSSDTLANAKVSDARDSEYRRLDVIANSETMTNKNSSVLYTANDLSEDHKELYRDYNMFADSAKINLNIVSGNKLPGVETTVIDGKVLDSSSVVINETYTKYDIGNIDFGLVERPETKVVLDKEISGIKLTTNDEKVIFEAKYNISYEEISKADAGDRVVVAELGNNRCLVAKVELDERNSKGIDQLQQLNKNEIKPTNGNPTGTQNFRFINVDAEILQGTTIELTYVITALNVGETDYTSAELDRITNNVDDNCSSEIKTEIKNLADEAIENSRKGIVNLGKALGTNYYIGKSAAVASPDVVVSSKVRQVIDYVDNDGVFVPENNTESNHMWRNTSITELTGNGHTENRLLDNKVIPEYEILDKKNISYITPQKNNVVLSTDSQNAVSGGNTNGEFERKLKPYEVDTTAGKTESKSQIVLTVTKVVSAQDDADNLTFDNLAEIVKFENTVGRRDTSVTVGNANPKFGEWEEALRERDTSATELVTFTPPTGIEVESQMKIQVLIIAMGAIGIVILGIVIIKKKVLNSK